MKKSIIKKSHFEALKEILLMSVYYYDGMLISRQNVNATAFFDKAEAEHLNNHFHLDSYMDCSQFTKDDFRMIAKYLFYRLKGEFPDVSLIVYLIYDEDGMPLIDFGARREGELLYYSEPSENREFFTTE